MTVTASALDWLLDSDEPGIVFQAKRDLLGEPDGPEAAQVLEGLRGGIARRMKDAEDLHVVRPRVLQAVLHVRR